MFLAIISSQDLLHRGSEALGSSSRLLLEGRVYIGVVLEYLELVFCGMPLPKKEEVMEEVRKRIYEHYREAEARIREEAERIKEEMRRRLEKARGELLSRMSLA